MRPLHKWKFDFTIFNQLSRDDVKAPLEAEGDIEPMKMAAKRTFDNCGAIPR